MKRKRKEKKFTFGAAWSAVGGGKGGEGCTRGEGWGTLVTDSGTEGSREGQVDGEG